MQYKAYKYRIYPNKEQRVLIAKTFGCCRFVYNKALALKMALYQQEKKGISLFQLCDKIVEWKNSEETVWLKEVNSQALQMSLRNLDAAYTKFFKEKTGFPKFKSKHDNNQSFCNPQKTEIDWDANRVFIPKFKKGIKIVLDRKLEGKIKSSTVSRTPTGKYFISILVEENIENSAPSQAIENKTLGIDLGLTHFATFSNGTKIENPRHLKRYLKKLRRASRQHSRKKKGSINRNKSRIKLAKIHEKITNCRQDFLHKLTTDITKNQSYNNYTSIAMENLNIPEMLKNRKLARSINDVGWGLFRTLLTYKCAKYGKNLLIIGRFEPSSKMCSCGLINNELTLKDRIWNCSCGLTHDRDILAANNIRRFAFCKQNFLPQELREFTLGETCNSESANQEISKTKV